MPKAILPSTQTVRLSAVAHGTPASPLVFTSRLPRRGRGARRRLFTETDLRYDFAAAAVPEPATMLPAGTGTAFLALRRQRRRTLQP